MLFFGRLIIYVRALSGSKIGFLLQSGDAKRICILVLS